MINMWAVTFATESCSWSCNPGGFLVVFVVVSSVSEIYDKMCFNSILNVCALAKIAQIVRQKIVSKPQFYDFWDLVRAVLVVNVGYQQ